MSTEAALETRALPVQRRAQERVDALLDAAAAVVDEIGIAGLTTSLVAERSDSSVGVVYRYFPNIDALVLALAERNLARFAVQVQSGLDAGRAETWEDFARLCVDEYAGLARTEPAFRFVRFGDIVAQRFALTTENGNDALGREFIGMLVERYGFAESEELSFAMTVSMECMDAITRRAFLNDRNGEERFLDAAKRMAIEIFAPYAPASSRS